MLGWDREAGRADLAQEALRRRRTGPLLRSHLLEGGNCVRRGSGARGRPAPCRPRPGLQQGVGANDRAAPTAPSGVGRPGRRLASRGAATPGGVPDAPPTPGNVVELGEVRTGEKVVGAEDQPERRAGPYNYSGSRTRTKYSSRPGPGGKRLRGLFVRGGIVSSEWDAESRISCSLSVTSAAGQPPLLPAHSPGR